MSESFPKSYTDYRRVYVDTLHASSASSVDFTPGEDALIKSFFSINNDKEICRSVSSSEIFRFLSQYRVKRVGVPQFEPFAINQCFQDSAYQSGYTNKTCIDDKCSFSIYTK